MRRRVEMINGGKGGEGGKEGVTRFFTISTRSADPLDIILLMMFSFYKVTINTSFRFLVIIS